MEYKTARRLLQQCFPAPPTPDTMKIVSENNAMCRDRVGRNFGVAQLSCMAARELCQGCDVWTTIDYNCVPGLVSWEGLVCKGPESLCHSLLVCLLLLLSEQKITAVSPLHFYICL